MSQTILNRLEKPLSKNIERISFDFPEQSKLDNGTDVFIYHDGSSEVVRIEFQFKAGTYYGSKQLVAGFTNKLVASGTSEMSEKQISEKLDYYGAFFENHLGADEASR